MEDEIIIGEPETSLSMEHVTFEDFSQNNIKTYIVAPKNIRKVFKCPICDRHLIGKSALYTHIYKAHSDALPEGMSAAQYCFNIRNHKNYGICVQCRTNKTKWNEEAERYERFCSDECKNKYILEAKRRMVAKYGKEYLLDDPNMQQKMMDGRSISGIYKFPDNTETHYMGSYEKDFLQTSDIMYGYTGKDIIKCPYVFSYEYNNKKHLYIPDYYMFNFNLIIEIKDGGDNPNNHPKIQAVDKVMEKSKDQAMLKQTDYNFIKIVNKDYRQFITILKMIVDTSWDDPEFKLYKNGIIIIPE